MSTTTTPTAYIKTLTENSAQIFPRTKYNAVYSVDGTENLETKLNAIDSTLSSHDTVVKAVRTITSVDTEQDAASGITKVIINYANGVDGAPIPSTEIEVADGQNFQIDVVVDRNFTDAEGNTLTDPTAIAQAMNEDVELQTFPVGETVSCMEYIFAKKLDGAQAIWKYLGPIGAVGFTDLSLAAAADNKQHLYAKNIHDITLDLGRVEGKGIENIELTESDGIQNLTVKIEDQDAVSLGRVQGVGIQNIEFTDNGKMNISYDIASKETVVSGELLPHFTIDENTKHLTATYTDYEGYNVDLGNILTDLETIANEEEETGFSIRSIQTVEDEVTPLHTIQFNISQGLSYELNSETNKDIIELKGLFGTVKNKAIPVYDEALGTYEGTGVYITNGYNHSPQLVIGAGPDGYPADKIPEGLLTCLYYSYDEDVTKGEVRTLMNFKRNGRNGQLIIGNDGETIEDEGNNYNGPIQIYWYNTSKYYACMTSSVKKDLSNNLQFNLDVQGTITWDGADYAEYFEWADSNTNQEDRRGLFVTFAEDGEQIRLANETDDYILGIVSSHPSALSNNRAHEWQGKYLTNAFGDRILDEDGNPIINPKYDETVKYIPRADRAEWAQIGLMGQLVMCDDGTCQVGKYCSSGRNGIATAAATGWRVMKRIDKNHIKVLFK